MPLVTIDFSDDVFSNSKEALDLILGPPGEGAFATSPGDARTNAPGQARFYPNTVGGREKYLNDAAVLTEQGRNCFLNSAIWSDAVLSLKNRTAPLSIGGAVQPIKFWCLWVDVDKGTTELTRELLEELTRQGAILSYSGGKTPQGKRKFHLRLLLDQPIENVDEFYRLNRWLAVAMGGEKFAPVSWLTLPGSTRFKAEYPGGKSETKAHIARGGRLWPLRTIRRTLEVYTPEPTHGVVSAADASDLVPEAVAGVLPIAIKRVLRQHDPGDGNARHKQTNKLVKLCAETGYTKQQALWVLQQHEPSVAKFGHRLPSQVHACWPAVVETVEEVEELFEDLGLLENAKTGDWLKQQVFPPMVWAVPDVIPEGLGMIVAPPKAGKSWWVANIGLACASGGKALGMLDVDIRPVLYLALEDSHRRLQERFTQLMGSLDAIPSGITVLITCEPNVVIPTILEFMSKYESRAPLVIVDTLGKARGHNAKKEDSYAADYAFTSQLKNAVDQTPGAALLMVHHTRKAESDDFVNSASGTQGIAGAMDFILALQRKRNSNEAVLHLTGRDVEENSFAMKFQNGHWKLNGDSLAEAASQIRTETDEALSDRSRAILALVNNSGLTGTNTARVVSELGVSTATAGVYLKRLHDAGRIHKKARGLYVSVEAEEI